MIVLVSRGGKFFFVKDTKNPFHSQFGVVTKEDLDSKPGTIVRTNTGKELIVIEPSFFDLYRRIKRGPQIIPVKDLSSIISNVGVGKDSIILEAGSGSGASACYFANFAKHVYTYELREDFFKITAENVKFLGLKNVTAKLGDVYEKVDEENIDLVLLDLSEPWKAVKVMSSALKVGGFLVSYCPTTPQVSDFVSEVNKHINLLYLRTTEVIERDWEVLDRKVRPKSASIGHSGFLSFVRKIGN